MFSDFYGSNFGLILFKVSFYNEVKNGPLFERFGLNWELP